jgi:hypothetical protein
VRFAVSWTWDWLSTGYNYPSKKSNRHLAVRNVPCFSWNQEIECWSKKSSPLEPELSQPTRPHFVHFNVLSHRYLFACLRLLSDPSVLPNESTDLAPSFNTCSSHVIYIISLLLSTQIILSVAREMWTVRYIIFSISLLTIYTLSYSWKTSKSVFVLKCNNSQSYRPPRTTGRIVLPQVYGMTILEIRGRVVEALP